MFILWYPANNNDFKTNLQSVVIGDFRNNMLI